MLLFQLPFLSGHSFTQNRTIRCPNEGGTINRPEITVFDKMKRDARSQKDTIVAPIRAGKFDYYFECEWRAISSLLVQGELDRGSFVSTHFIADNNTVHLILSP